jgi:hypothetical protein
LTFSVGSDIFIIGICALIKILLTPHYINIAIIPRLPETQPLKKEFFEEKLIKFSSFNNLNL